MSSGVHSAVRTVLHVDLDAFFASVEERDDPSLRGKPVVVGGDPRGGRGRGVVAAANYEARRFGIHSAMPVSRAYRRCPDAVFLRPRGSEYVATSQRFMAILGRYSDLVEAISIDEAFLDVTGSGKLFGGGEEIARQIKETVRREERLVVSIGVAPVKFVAKIASDFEKPDGLVVVVPAEVEAFLDRVPIKQLWGAGPRAQERLRRLGVSTIGGLRSVPMPDLEATFGARTAAHFARLARGEDERIVNPHHDRKSVGRETTFLEDVADRAEVESTLLNLVEEVAARLRKKKLTGFTVTVKLRTADFHTVTRQGALPQASDTTEQIWPLARQLLRRADSTSRPIRLVGVALSGFEPEAQLSLFGGSRASDSSHKIAEALDSVSERFGRSAVQRGRTRRPGHDGSG